MGCCSSSDKEEVEEIKNLLDEARAENKRLIESINEEKNNVNNTEKNAKLESQLEKINQQLNNILNITLFQLQRKEMQDNISESNEELERISKEREEFFLKNKEYYKERHNADTDLDCELKDITFKLIKINRLIDKFLKTIEMKEIQDNSCDDGNLNSVTKESELYKLDEDINKCKEIQIICNGTNKTVLTGIESKNTENFIKQINDTFHKLHNYVMSINETQFESILNDEFQQYHNKVLEIFDNVKFEIQQCESEILTFKGSKSDKTSLHLQELLQRQISKLDKLQNLRNDERLRFHRKKLIAKIWDLERELNSRYE